MWDPPRPPPPRQRGKRWRADPRAIPLRKHAQIQLQLGKPSVKPVLIEFPAGL